MIASEDIRVWGIHRSTITTKHYNHNRALRGAFRVSTFLTTLRSRLPGGILLFDVMQSASEHRYGPKVTFARLFHHLAIYFRGCRFETRPVAELKPPYPSLFHFTGVPNTESIKERGLLPVSGKVWLTDWTDPRWVSRFGYKAVTCFRIDPERLASSGHKLTAMDRCHEFTTDHVPPDCLAVMTGFDAVS